MKAQKSAHNQLIPTADLIAEAVRIAMDRQCKDQLSAINMLLRKTLPDLKAVESAVEHSGKIELDVLGLE